MIKIDIKILLSLCDISFTKLEKLDYQNIIISHDYYWNVSLSDAYDFSCSQPKIVIGSLFDDFDWLQKVLKKENPSTTIDFERLGNIMQAIDYEIHRFQESKDLVILTVNFAEIKRLCQLLLTKATKAGFKELEIDIDRYWSVDSMDIYDFTREIPRVTIKSLINDWEGFKKNLYTKKNNDLEYLSRVMKGIGEAIHRSVSKINWLVNEE